MSEPLLDPAQSMPWWQSKVIWTQIVGISAGIASAAGVHVLDDPTLQLTIVGALTAIATVVFRVMSTKTIGK